MTVKQLIEQLQQLDPDIHVMTEGYEGGYKDAHCNSIGDPREVALNVHTEWYYGPHEQADDTYFIQDKSQYQIVKAIVI
jgi:hypothetical protein